MHNNIILNALVPDLSPKNPHWQELFTLSLRKQALRKTAFRGHCKIFIHADVSNDLNNSLWPFYYSPEFLACLRTAFIIEGVKNIDCITITKNINPAQIQTSIKIYKS